MKVSQKQANNDSNRSATAATQISRQNQSAQITNNNKEAIAQRAFIAGINSSPHMLAQRRQIESYIGIGQQQTIASVYSASSINQQQLAQRLEKPDDEKEETVQAEPASESQFQLKNSIPKANNTGLPDNLKSGIESLSGIAMDNVKVHYNSSQPAQLNALAYAQGTDIHIAPGQEQHLPHEAWHVVQQAQGRVRPTMQMKDGVPVNDDQGLEHEADVMGSKAARMEVYADNRKLMPPALSNSQATVAQGKWFRMSTLLDSTDEIEVAEIQALADRGNFFEAFGKILSKYPELSRDFDAINARFGNEEIRLAAFNILWETFEDPSKAYTAAEVMELLEDNEIISQEADVLDETDNDDDDIESLITQFRDMHISVPFRSDVDQQKEEHNVYWETDDIIVRSNPKPLKDMIAQGNWEGYPISAPLRIQLNGLRKTAKLALYKIAGNAKRNITGARTKSNMNAFRNTLDAIAKILSNLGGGAHAASLMPLTNLSTSANHGNDVVPTEGTHVVAAPLSIKSSNPGSAPKDGRLMKSIRNLAGPQSKSYVQMHLLNDLVFGPGQLWNLTPGPKQSNVDMEKNVEDPLKRAVLGKGLVINFEAKVNYNNNPTAATNIQIQQNPDKYRFQSIDFSAEQLEYDQASSSWGPASVQDPDVKKVNGSRVTWRYGSLTPLVPKPRILDPATTLQELTSANIQPAAAKRIMAFITNNPAWRPSGGNKQQQLAQAVKAWDKGKTIPNISSWKATSVLWT
ncbi:MAG: eCIS core domain-containing protein [Methylobacter sp.]